MSMTNDKQEVTKVFFKEINMLLIDVYHQQLWVNPVCHNITFMCLFIFHLAGSCYLLPSAIGI